MHYRFNRTVTVQGMRHKAGSDVKSVVIPPGSLESMLRSGLITPIEETAPSASEPELILTPFESDLPSGTTKQKANTSTPEPVKKGKKS